ncbi:hypothetical protein ACQCSX_07250 [Pseudarthrobacter sp. P1]|uniref:hypothetical protein n=1 Tax=Pseudarthrobacter sp. P1 TaxID=3418418 RepID=UPI003CFA8733
MTAFSEFFVTDHHTAVARAKSLDAGKAPSADVPVLPVPGLSDFEIEVLGELAAKTVHATGISAELGMVDIELDSLFVVPEALAEIFAELVDLEDPEELPELAAAWAAAEEMESTPEVTEPLVRALAALAGTVDEGARTHLYFYSAA